MPPTCGLRLLVYLTKADQAVCQEPPVGAGSPSPYRGLRPDPDIELQKKYVIGIGTGRHRCGAAINEHVGVNRGSLPLATAAE
jgi:hypothetical protein